MTAAGRCDAVELAEAPDPALIQYAPRFDRSAGIVFAKM